MQCFHIPLLNTYVTVLCDLVTGTHGIVVCPSNLGVCDSFTSGSERYVHSVITTVVNAMDGVLMLGSTQ